MYECQCKCHSGKAKHIAMCPCIFEKEKKMSEKTVDSVEPVLDEQIIGMEKQAAITKIEAAGQVPRIVFEDGEQFAVTMDYRTDRLNLEVVQGKITGSHRG